MELSDRDAKMMVAALRFAPDPTGDADRLAERIIDWVAARPLREMVSESSAALERVRLEAALGALADMRTRLNHLADEYGGAVAQLEAAFENPDNIAAARPSADGYLSAARQELLEAKLLSARIGDLIEIIRSDP